MALPIKRWSLFLQPLKLGLAMWLALSNGLSTSKYDGCRCLVSACALACPLLLLGTLKLPCEEAWGGLLDKWWEITCQEGATVPSEAPRNHQQPEINWAAPDQNYSDCSQNHEQMKMIAVFKILSFRLVCYTAKTNQYTHVITMCNKVMLPHLSFPPSCSTTPVTLLWASEPAPLLSNMSRFPLLTYMVPITHCLPL